ncbi:MnhB domain-containing protein [Halorubellus salinus]|uniref:MnhB domain-containing protein n=1 Tax=Halorubellus salinus TaxID=755309 RepID=UPI001D091930|nr:MnhB domain-containing protein [Halorubellus salinus]
MSDRNRSEGADDTTTRTRSEFTDSPVVTTTVRLLAPFVLTYGLFTLFHGTASVGGGFQGGVVGGAMVITVAFAFGIRPTAEWLDERALVALVVAGPVVFGVVALAGLASGGAFLQLDVLPIPKATVYATEAIEIGIGATVAAVIVVLFLRIADGYREPTVETPADLEGPGDADPSVGAGGASDD